jgi:hypothetical protein
MKFPIDSQYTWRTSRYRKLQQKAVQLKINEPLDLTSAMNELQYSYQCYRIATKTSWGYFCSFFPITVAYHQRVKFDNCITIAKDKLNQLKEEVEKAEKVKARQSTRSQSAPELPKCYKSPINKLKAQDKTFNEGNQDGYRNQRAGISF